MKNLFILTTAALFAASVVCSPLSAQTTDTPEPTERLARVFQDNMVLQREMPVPIWGWAKPGTQVEVAFAGQKKTAKTDNKGYWKAVLDPLKASAEPQELTAQIGGTTVTLKNILVGEVWMAVGHSGTVCGGPNPDIDTGVYPVCNVSTGEGKPEVRIFHLFDGASLEPFADLDPAKQHIPEWRTFNEKQGKWNSQTDFFARMLRDKLDVPVGILHPLCLGQGQQPWMPREVLEAFTADDGEGNCYDRLLEGVRKRHERDLEKLVSEGKEPVNIAFPSAGYNAKVVPLAPFAMRGVQFFAAPGGNMGAAAGTAATAKAWRELFGQDFYFVNCASGHRVRTTAQPFIAPGFHQFGGEDAIYDSLALFPARKDGEKREVIVNTKDLGTWLAHNYERGEGGRRMALATLALAYGHPLPADGATPQLESIQIENGKSLQSLQTAVARFRYVGDGMRFEPSIDGISGVYLRGKDGTARWAHVKVTGKDTVVFSHPDIAEIATVGYGQAVNSHETLFNSAGLPAAPFNLNPPGKEDNELPQPTDAQKPPANLVAVNYDDLGKGGLLSLAHIRRHGYVFQFITTTKPVPDTIGDTVPVTVYIPAEWKGHEVMLGDSYWIRECYEKEQPKMGFIRSGGQLVKTIESTDAHGNKLATFDAPLDGTWVIVAEKGKAESFRKINRY